LVFKAWLVSVTPNILAQFPELFTVSEGIVRLGIYHVEETMSSAWKEVAIPLPYAVSSECSLYPNQGRNHVNKNYEAENEPPRSITTEKRGDGQALKLPLSTKRFAQ